VGRVVIRFEGVTDRTRLHRFVMHALQSRGFKISGWGDQGFWMAVETTEELLKATTVEIEKDAEKARLELKEILSKPIPKKKPERLEDGLRPEFVAEIDRKIAEALAKPQKRPVPPKSNSTEKEDYRRSGFGNWSKSGVPHRGWECIEMEDIGEDLETCEMCLTAQVRYVHVMRHSQFPRSLRCGCICAAAMEQDYVAAVGREEHFKRRQRHPYESMWIERCNEILESDVDAWAREGIRKIRLKLMKSRGARKNKYVLPPEVEKELA